MSKVTALELAVSTQGIAANAVVAQAEAYFAFLSDAPAESAAPAAPAKKAGKAKAATESAPPAATQPQAAPAPAAQPAPSQAAPTSSVSKEQLNKAVTNFAGINRDGAIALLGKFGVRSTATLPVEKYQEVFDAFEEEQAKYDAAAANASLV